MRQNRTQGGCGSICGSTDAEQALIMKTALLAVLVAILVPRIDSARGRWRPAHATFYGGSDASGTMYGACGYGDMYSMGYGTATTALSAALFHQGQTCGACLEVKCWGVEACVAGNPSIVVTATNLCPQNSDKPDDDGGWCNLPLKHLDMSEPAFLQLAEYKAGIVPVRYRRVACARAGGVRFVLNGNRWFNLVLVYNVAGSGEVIHVAVQVEGSSQQSDWIPMTRNWGQNWETHTILTGHILSFRVTTSNGRVRNLWDVAPRDWQFGQTFEAATNF